MSWAQKRVLVTGAGGFIGSHLAERLVVEGAQVRALVHYNALGSRGWLDTSPHTAAMNVMAGDICDPESVNKAVDGCDVVFHLAALIAIPYSYVAPRSYVRTNVEGTLNVLEACRTRGVKRLLHTSTSEVYGTAQYVPIDEKHPLQGQSPYSASKIGADKIVESYHRSFGVPAVTVRPFNTFGPRQSMRAIVPTVVGQLLAGSEVRLGNADATRDLNFVSNTVDGFLAAASLGRPGAAYNLGTGREISVADLVALIGRLIGREPNIKVSEERMRPAASEVDRLLADALLARTDLEWSPAIDLETGLKIVIEHMRDQPPPDVRSYRV